MATNEDGNNLTEEHQEHLPKFTLVRYSNNEHESDSFDQEQEGDLVAFEVHEIEGEELQEIENDEEDQQQHHIELTKVHNNAFSAFTLDACPECCSSVCLRPVQECCGHVKCRHCYLTNDEGCKQCIDHNASLQSMGQNDEAEDCEQLEAAVDKKQEILEYSYNISTEGAIIPSANEYILELEQASGDESIALVSSETLKQLGINHESVNLGCTQITTISSDHSSTQIEFSQESSSESQQTPSSRVEIDTSYETTEIVAIKEEGKRGKKPKQQQTKPMSSDHIVILATNPLKYKCLECTQEFKQEYRRKFHLHCNPENGNRPFSCQFCSNEFMSRSHYEYHLRSKHTQERPYQCSICSYQFITKMKLERHLATHNSSPRVIRSKFYLCAYCKKRFNNLSNCKKHLRTHTEEKPFECVICKKCFTQKTTLEVHMRTHDGNRPHKCQEPGCSKAFATKKDCRRHFLCHTNSKPFPCSVCKQKFRRKDNLERHIRNTHHFEKDIVKMLSKKAAEKYQEYLRQSEQEPSSHRHTRRASTTEAAIVDNDIITGL